MNDQPILDQIIKGELRPWLGNNKHNEKFTHKIVNQSVLGFKTLYEIDFYRYFNPKTKYYYKLIINEANNYCNRIIEMIDGDILNIRNLLDDTLNKNLRPLLKDAAKLIKANDYDLNYINPSKSDFNIDRDQTPTSSSCLKRLQSKYILKFRRLSIPLSIVTIIWRLGCCI